MQTTSSLEVAMFGKGAPKAPVQYDLHTRRAAKHFGIEPQDITPAQRLVGKTLNYYEAWTA